MYICPSRSFVRHALLSVTLLIWPSCSIVRHTPYLAVTLYCPSRSSTHARKDGRGVTHVYARTSSRVGWTDGDGGGERVHARPNATLRNYSCAYLELRRTLRYAARYAAPVKIEIYSGPLTQLGQLARNYINPPLSILILSLRLRWHMMSSRTSSFNTGPLQN